MTTQGIRRGRSPVDRLIARSSAKTRATVDIVAAEARTLGDRLRILVLCDHEQASATGRGSLREVLGEQAGSARLVLSDLVADQRTAPLNPVLVTGRRLVQSSLGRRRHTVLRGRPLPRAGRDARPAR